MAFAKSSVRAERPLRLGRMDSVSDSSTIGADSKRGATARAWRVRRAVVDLHVLRRRRVRPTGADSTYSRPPRRACVAHLAAHAHPEGLGRGLDSTEAATVASPISGSLACGHPDSA